VANSPQARKRARQNDKRRLNNAGMRSMMRTHVKKVIYALDAGDKAAASEAYKAAVPAIDKAADKGLIHKHKASRYKSRLNTRIRALA
jgi:small subunit ribosomal protein S20